MVGNSRTQRILLLQRVLLLPAAGGRLGTASPVLRCAVQWHGSCSAQSKVKPPSQRCSQPWWPFFLFPFHFSLPLPVTFPRINAAVRFSALQMQAGKKTTNLSNLNRAAWQLTCLENTLSRTKLCRSSHFLYGVVKGVRAAAAWGQKGTEGHWWLQALSQACHSHSNRSLCI